MRIAVIAAIFLAPQSAEETLSKIEDALAGARTISVTFRFSGEPKPGEMGNRGAGEGTVLLKEGGKVNLSLRGTDGQKRREFSVVSDGQKLRIKLVGKARDEAAPGRFKDAMAVAVARLGPGVAMFYTDLIGPDNPKEMPDFKKVLPVSDVKPGADEKEGRSIRYRVKYEDDGQVFDIRLWYDPQTFRPLKRVVEVAGSTGASVVAETYEGVAFDAEIPDERFRIPADE